MADDLQFLFRFRDLVAKTIDSHQSVIKTHGATWWGWWKRPSEDNRAEVWHALAKATETNPIAVGLFDSGGGRVYRALVTGIIPPEEHGELVKPPADRDLVPSYYRESPFSRAWMRLTHIEPMNEFFGHYSFRKAPDLPNYRKELLQRFVNKKITESSELRGMDTTIWEIRPSIATDPSDKILLTTHALSAAVTGEVVRLKSNTILHITDLHFALDRFRDHHVWRLESEVEETANTLSSALKAGIGIKQIGGVIVSGDLTFLGSAAEFDEALNSLNKLLGLLDLAPDHLIVVPGNHDIQWSTNGNYAPGEKVTAAPAEAKKNYEAFYERLFQHPPSKHLAMGRRWLLPSGLTLEIAALNSSSLQTGKNFLAGMGRIDEASLEEVRIGLGWPAASDSQLSGALRLLAIHHHLAVTEDIEPDSGFPQGYGMAVDAVRIQRMAAKHRVQLALHGHKHRAFLWRSSVYDLPEHASTNYKLGEISLIGGGSAGSKETEGASNYFNLLDFSPAGLDVLMYRARAKGSFERFKTFRAPFGRFEDGGLKLEDWSVVE
ncbi:metallophosphoesterase family protein [Sphingomonas sp. DC2300-3]|uniref:metallophosphoesterase family protein n=1 Tax=unclassified Sphingomonas TaxID=196159 RepID=UPI003CFA4341